MTDNARGFFKRIAGAVVPPQGPVTLVAWQPLAGNYPRLLSFEARALSGRAGLYLLWHLGVRPQWLRAGYSNDLGAAVAQLAADPEVAAFAAHDGPFFAWSFCPPARAPGLINDLINRLHPVLQDRVFPCDAALLPEAPMVSCPLPAGTKEIGAH